MNFLHTYNPEPKKQISASHIYNLLFWIIIFGIIGGRIGHIIGELNYYQQFPENILRIWQGGIAFHGVLIASLIVVYIYTKIKKISFWLVTDLIVVALPLMQSIGRWGNYLNQEIFGQPTESAWGIPIDLARRPAGFEQYTYFHPIFLYESLLMILVFILLLYLFNKNKPKIGQLTLLYFVIFSGIRFSLDFFRIDMPSIGPLLITQWLSIVLFVGAVIIWIMGNKKETPE